MTRLTLVLLALDAATLVSGHSGRCPKCTIYQYCKSYDDGCGECREVCESNAADYNWVLCKEECFDYLRDKTHIAGTIEEHRDAINKIYTLAVAMTVLLVLLVLMVGGLVFRKVHRYTVRRLKKLERKNYKEKMSAVQYSINNNNTMRDREGNGSGQSASMSNLRNGMPSTITLNTQPPESSPTSTNSSATKTLPLSSEEPSEDTTLDYASYINHGMSHSQSKETDLNTTPRY